MSIVLVDSGIAEASRSLQGFEANFLCSKEKYVVGFWYQCRISPFWYMRFTFFVISTNLDHLSSWWPIFQVRNWVCTDAILHTQKGLWLKSVMLDWSSSGMSDYLISKFVQMSTSSAISLMFCGLIIPNDCQLNSINCSLWHACLLRWAAGQCFDLIWNYWLTDCKTKPKPKPATHLPSLSCLDLSFTLLTLLTLTLAQSEEILSFASCVHRCAYV